MRLTHTTIYKTDKQQGFTYNTGNCIQYAVITCNGKESEKGYVYTCITESLRCIPETNTTL